MHAATREHGLRHRLHQAGFNALYRRSLIYNQCWEDPALDRVALDLGPDSEVMVITSAGCNALDYLLCEPKAVHAVDANPRQNALLELKVAGIRGLVWDDFFQVFGLGRHPDMEALYHADLRHHLSEESAAYWDRNLDWWKRGPVRRGLYDHGLSGVFARAFVAYAASRPSLSKALDRLFATETMEDQIRVWDEEVVPRMFGKTLRWALERQATMNLIGVPYEQQRTAGEEHGGSIAAYVQNSLTRVAHHNPVRENYFYRVYLEGGYVPEVCPEYLKRDNFDRLGTLVDRLNVTTTLVTDYLQSMDSRPTHLVLLDHMDWMGTAFPDALAEEWATIQQVAAPGARVLFRSGERVPRFLDGVHVDGTPIRDLLRFHPDLADELHLKDRVGTYMSFWIGDLATVG